MQPGTRGAGRDPELIGDGAGASADVEGFDDDAAMSRRKLLQGAFQQPPVQHLIKRGIFVSRLGQRSTLQRDAHRPGPSSAFGVGGEISGDVKKPRPNRPVVLAQLGKMAPGTDERLLHDVLAAAESRQ